MNTFKKLTLYSTSHCHLCDNALGLTLQFVDKSKIEIIDIANNDDLLALYETKIPVLKCVDNAQTLEWPFTKKDLENFLS